MGEGVLILAFVVIVIGGIGSVRGALVAALLVGLVDTLGRAFLPGLLRAVIDGPQADTVGANLSQVSIYLFMAIILAWKPKGLFPAHG
jgi:branched-chain amino acid transport system permease protein